MIQPTSQPIHTKHRVKAIIGGSVSNLVEWYDWYSNSAFATATPLNLSTKNFLIRFPKRFYF